ncbi:hypothetical protein MINTM005_42880 [Mycobacterium intracellulare]|nr:hypothetical protein MINTM005_42880 [Mycobacterium intracellulare]BCO96225.1 hypothetical protein MINTM016_42010 [Mycobacterium intracellulare]BCP33567.1 hypothetical protein MINTM026_45370 [Mycobacterium intracellulare]
MGTVISLVRPETSGKRTAALGAGLTAAANARASASATGGADRIDSRISFRGSTRRFSVCLFTLLIAQRRVIFQALVPGPMLRAGRVRRLCT